MDKKGIGVILIICIFLSFVLLQGCATTQTVTILKQHPKTVLKTINSDKNYQIVYEAMYSHMRDCWQSNDVLTQCIVSGTIYSELRKAEITTGLPGFTLNVFEIQGNGNGSTINSYMSPVRYKNEGTPDERIKMIMKWIDGYDLCE
jgi:hypothetical protein